MNSVLNSSREMGIRYLSSAISEIGRFAYLRDVKSGQVSNRKYNLIRHAGCTLALLEASDGGAGESDESVLRALDVCLRHRRGVGGGGRSAIVYDGMAKLGATALGLAALTELLKKGGGDEHRKTSLSFGDYLLSQQDGEGRFASLLFLEAAPRAFESLYYPGEAILALTRLAKAAGTERHLRGAYLGAKFLARRYADLSLGELPADHWLMLAVRELDSAVPDGVLRRTVIRLGEAIVSSATKTADGRLTFWGADARLCPAATRAEGLGAAVEVAAREGRNDKVVEFLICLERAVAFCLSCQVDDSYVTRWPRAKDAVGGFIHSWGKPCIRIDYVQHAVGAISALARSRSLLACAAS